MEVMVLRLRRNPQSIKRFAGGGQCAPCQGNRTVKHCRDAPWNDDEQCEPCNLRQYLPQPIMHRPARQDVARHALPKPRVPRKFLNVPTLRRRQVRSASMLLDE